MKLLPIPGVSSSDANLPETDLGENTTIHRHTREDELTQDLNPAGRIKNDLQIAAFYLGDWNYHGAYLRYKDALQLNDVEPEAIFGVAKSACMQNLTAEALAESKDYLDLYPKGKHAKEAQKMLREPKNCKENRAAH